LVNDNFVIEVFPEEEAKKHLEPGLPYMNAITHDRAQLEKAAMEKCVDKVCFVEFIVNCFDIIQYSEMIIIYSVLFYRLFVLVIRTMAEEVAFRVIKSRQVIEIKLKNYLLIN